MRLKNRWWQEERWLSYIVAFGHYHLILSFCLATLTGSFEHGAFAVDRMSNTKNMLWMQNETRSRIKDWRSNQEFLWKGKNRTSEFNNKHIRWKKGNRKDRKVNDLYTKIYGVHENSIFNGKEVAFTRMEEQPMMKFVNKDADQNTTRRHVRNAISTENGNLSYSWAIRIPTKSNSNLGRNHFHNTADRLAKHHGLINFGPIGGLDGYYYFVHRNFFNVVDKVDDNGNEKQNITDNLLSHPEIEWVKHEPIQIRKKRTLEFKDQFFPSQWHLVNLKFVNHDINVTGVWEHNITGRGVVVSVIDDGVEWTNPDILDNYSPEGSWDLNSNDGDPMPRVDEAGLNHHGTRCAGEIAAVANEYCAVGVAYEARVSGIRILDGPMTDSLEAMAFNTKMEVNDVYSCSWGPDDNGKTVDGPHRLAQAALAHGVMAGRKGYGSIYVVASGNGGHFKDNCNFDGYANSIFTVTIGAVDELGQMPYYAEHCAAMLAVTYSSGQGHQRNIVTTDWRLGTGTGCTDRHTGTSAAAPLAAGIIALMLQVRKCLTWRDIQHIIVYTAVKVPIDKDEWRRNGAGFSHSHKHGFGLLNSWKLVTAAKMWESVPFMTSWSSPILKVNKELPSAGQLSQVFRVDKDMANEVITLEHVTLTVNLNHPCRGDIAVNLISPSGTISKLATPRKYDRSSDGFIDWTFSTVRYWGERPQGTWKINIRDEANQPKRGRLKSWRLTFYGSAMTPKEIQQRRKLVKEVSSGNYLSGQGPPCQPPPSPLTEKISISSRFLKVLLLLSGFFSLVSTYFLLEAILTNQETFRTIDLNESDIQSIDGFDIKNFLPKELTAQDQVRLNILLEGGGSKQQCKDTQNARLDAETNVTSPSKPTSVSILVTPDELSEMKEFEERLKTALEQSRVLQSQQMSQIANIENEIANTKDGLEFFDMAEERAKKTKKPRKLKGILKKPK